MEMVGRAYNPALYRFGFSGKENVNEVEGIGDQIDYGMRGYDPRRGQFWCVDPLTKKYPWNSTYSFAEGNPIAFIDLDGGERKYYTRTFDENGKPKITYSHTEEIIEQKLVVNYSFYNGLDIHTETVVNPRQEFVVENIGDPDNQVYDAKNDKMIPYKESVTFSSENAALNSTEEDYQGTTADIGWMVVSGLTRVANEEGGGNAYRPAKAPGKAPTVELPESSPQFDPLKPALKTGGLTVPASENGYAPDFEGTPYLYQAKQDESNIVKIKMTGSYAGDAAAANAAANLKNTPKNFSWHHLDDFNPATGEATLQLVNRQVHQATTPHTGDVKQYEVKNSTTYKK